MKTSLWLMTAITLTALATTSSAQSPTTGATVINSNKVAAAFAGGMPLLENSEFRFMRAGTTLPVSRRSIRVIRTSFTCWRGRPRS